MSRTYEQLEPVISALDERIKANLEAFPTDTASGAVASFPDGADGIPLKSLVVDINPVQSGSGDPSPDNVRPISGWTQVNVSHSDADMSNPTTLTISLGQTVYGGKLDVLSGELVIDFAKITIDGSSAIGQTGSAVSSPVLIQAISPTNNIAYVDEKTIPRCLCGSYLPPKAAYEIYRSAELGIAVNQSENGSSRRIWMRLPEVTTEAQAKTYLTNNPIEVVYPIYNPLTVQLTPHEVTALLGSNNVWADTGDTGVEYRADPTLYIQRLTEPDADMIADSNIVSGQYFMVGNILYKATANIASGSAVIVGTNCTHKSLSEALNEINQ